MINTVTIINPLGESLTMELGSPEKSGFSILSIEGLGPVKANLALKNMSSIDGAMVNSARLPIRNIVLEVGFIQVLSDTDLDTIEKIRQLSYRFFPVKQQIGLILESDVKTVMTSGYVESNDPTIFSSDEKTSISVICEYPYFYSVDNQSTLFAGVSPTFSFPFSNESTVAKLISFGNIANNYQMTVNYTGDAEVGITISFHALGAVVNPVIYNARTLDLISIDTTKLATMTGFGIILGDDITITTMKGNKSITLTRAGVKINILNTIAQNTSWPTLVYGDNIFIYDATAGKENMLMDIENQVLFQGI